ncbi:MAG: PAS domain-containing protein, partial [Polyangiaceae bacterium]|nr:PAS domain-containing protein [Polyangiaceae bacterium]
MGTAGEIEDLVFQTLLEQPVPVAIFCWRPTEGWAVEFVSPNVRHVLGYTAEDFLSRRVLYADIVHPEDIERVTREVQAHSGSGDAAFEHEDYRIIDPQGRTRWVRDVTAAIRDASGRVTRLIGYIFESTARHEALEALAAAKHEAEAATRARTEFFMNVSHEFRTPLTLLLGPLDDLLAGPLETEQRDALQTMRRNAHRLLRLVSSLLAFAPIDAGRASATFTATDLAASTREIAGLFLSAAHNANLDLVLD